MRTFKNSYKYIFIFLALFIFTETVNATTYTVTVNDKEGLNIRSGPGTNYDIVTGVSNKTVLTLVNTTTKNKDSNCSGGWYQIKYGSSTSRYVCSDFVTKPVKQGTTTISNLNDYYTSTGWQYRISEDYAYVRDGRSTSSSRVDTVYMGTTVNILGSYGSNSLCSSGWYKISYYNNRKGYVCKSLVEKYDDITSADKAYNKILKEEGFPESYWPYLSYLHKKHPKWIFKASKTNKKWDTVIDKEENKNYIQSSESVYVTSQTEKEAGGWKTATNAVNAYFLDPRNYLTEKNIFAFEKLSYDSTIHKKDIVKTIFGTSYLADDKYVGYFMDAATSYDVSPVHLASRVKKEGGTKSTYDAITGKSNLTYRGKSLKGVYNYYNIGAYQDKYTKSPVARGLAAAKGIVDNYDGTPWDTREKAINYGAKFIAKDYINKGQNTIYYEKFNTGPNADNPAYTHQYQTNIIAPASESLSTYRAYVDSNIINTAFKFEIPVYNNMPSDNTIHPPIGNTNNDLSYIKINGASINGFDEDILTYDHYIPSDATEVKVEASPKVSSSSITGTGTIKISADKTNVKLIVKSQVNTTKTYTISLIKSKEVSNITPTVSEIVNKVDVKITDNYLSGIYEQTTPASLGNMINKKYPNAKITIKDSKGKTKSSVLATGDKITIASKDTKTYTIVIRGDTNGDGKVNIFDLVNVQKDIKNSKKLKNHYKEAGDTNYDGKINIFDLVNVQKRIVQHKKLK